MGYKYARVEARAKEGTEEAEMHEWATLLTDSLRRPRECGFMSRRSIALKSG